MKKSKIKAVVIVGSARKDGQTNKAVSELVSVSGWDVIDLLDYNIAHFDYEHRNRYDDFIPLMKRIIEDYEVLIFATPVYWYSMSGLMKVFFDRITDLLKIEKPLGRKLSGKSMAVLSCSNGNNLEDQFWLPFKNSADYLGMVYLADVHMYQGQLSLTAINDFKKQIENNIN